MIVLYGILAIVIGAVCLAIYFLFSNESGGGSWGL